MVSGMATKKITPTRRPTWRRRWHRALPVTGVVCRLSLVAALVVARHPRHERLIIDIGDVGHECGRGLPSQGCGQVAVVPNHDVTVLADSEREALCRSHTTSMAATATTRLLGSRLNLAEVRVAGSNLVVPLHAQAGELPELLDLSDHRAAQKLRLGGEVFPNIVEGGSGKRFSRSSRATETAMQRGSL
jgi:hypothetical protein